MSGLHIPPFAGGSPEEAKNGNRGQGLQSTPTAAGRGGMRSRTGAMTIVGERGAKKVASKEDGKAASRQLSRSYFVPRTLEGYERYLRQIQCEGYLQRRSRTTGTWRRRWFLLKDGYLSYFQDQDEAETYRSEADARFHHHPSSQRQLSLGCVEAVRTEEKIGPWVFRVISTDRDDLVLQAESKEGMNDWLFGFHRALASIIARLMETGSWAVGNGSRSLRGGGAGGEGPAKVLGHGHGRARRLSLRQQSLPKNEVEKSTIDSCEDPATAAAGAEIWDSQGTTSRTNGKHHHKDCSVPIVSTAGSERARSVLARDDDRGNGGNRVGGIAPNSSHARQRRVLSCNERRRRAESMGNWASLGFGGFGNGYVGNWSARENSAHENVSRENCTREYSAGESGGAREFAARETTTRDYSAPDYGDREFTSRGAAASEKSAGNASTACAVTGRDGHAAPQATNASRVTDAVKGGGAAAANAERACERGLLSRALSASGRRASAGMSDENELEKLDNICRQRREILKSNDAVRQQKELQQKHVGALSATNVTAAAIIVAYSSSSGDKERSSESGQGSTTDDEPMTSGVAGAIGLGLRMEVDVASRSLLATTAEDERGVKKPALLGGGGGKYLPPALRAAAKADASLSAVTKRTGGGGKYVPPAMRAAARAEAAPSLSEAFCGSSPGRLRPPGTTSLRNGLGGDSMVPAVVDVDMDLSFVADGVSSSLVTTTATAAAVSSRLPLPSPSSSYPRVNPGPLSSSIPPFGGAGCGATCSVLPGGLAFPWAPANKEHYYTGHYHAHQPCTRSWPCSEKRGGIGGGPTPIETPFPAPSSGDGEGLGESFAMDDDGVVDPAVEGLGFEARGLWWSCGAWSIMGRREKQEDRFCSMPDYTKSIASNNGRPGGTSTRGSRATPAASQGAEEGLEENGRGSSVGLAQGFFGVYDGHCGSEAVQFVRDRLHATVEEQSCFWKEPERAIRKAFLSVDEEFLSLAGEKDWYSGTTALVALMRGRKLLVGNLGDGEAVLCRKGQAVHMSPVHNPARPDENKRIQEANGWVTTEKELFVRQLKQMDLDDPEIRMAARESVKWNTITRVCGELAVSRSIGDRDFKGFTKRRLEQGKDGVVPQEATLFSWPKGHSGEFRDDLLTADPEFVETEIEEDDQFLLMACDGLWDVLGKTEAVSRAKHMFDEGLCPQAVAERMCELAYRMGTSDNVTAVVVQFHHDRPY